MHICCKSCTEAFGANVQEYLGSYVTDASGRLVFQEGALLTALRRGQWLVLDELNLAPSEVLEALNRWARAASGLGIAYLHGWSSACGRNS